MLKCEIKICFMIIGKNTYFLLETNSFLGKGNVYDVFILFMKLMGGGKNEVL